MRYKTRTKCLPAPHLVLFFLLPLALCTSTALEFRTHLVHETLPFTMRFAVFASLAAAFGAMGAMAGERRFLPPDLRLRAWALVLTDPSASSQLRSSRPLPTRRSRRRSTSSTSTR